MSDHPLCLAQMSNLLRKASIEVLPLYVPNFIHWRPFSPLWPPGNCSSLSATVSLFTSAPLFGGIGGSFLALPSDLVSTFSALMVEVNEADFISAGSILVVNLLCDTSSRRNCRNNSRIPGSSAVGGRSNSRSTVATRGRSPVLGKHSPLSLSPNHLCPLGFSTTLE